MIQSLSKLTLKPMKLALVQKLNGHCHLLNGNEVPGCTSISGLFSEDGWKFAWPPKLMAEKLLLVLADGKVICEADIKTAKNAWREKRDKSADTGTMGHSIVEEYIKHGTIPALVDGSEVANIFEQFMAWETQYKPTWIASEVQVGSEVNMFAGILDAIAVIDGKLVLVDFKTSAGIKDDYNIQLAGLMIALEEMGVKPDKRTILHIPKKGEYEYREIMSNLEADKEAFLAGLEFYKHKSLFLARSKKK